MQFFDALIDVLVYFVYPFTVIIALEFIRYVLSKRPKLELTFDAEHPATNYEAPRTITKRKKINGEEEAKMKVAAFWHFIIIRNKGSRLAQNCRVRVALISENIEDIDYPSCASISIIEWVNTFKLIVKNCQTN